MNCHMFALLLTLLVSEIFLVNGCHDYERAVLLSFRSHMEDPSNRLSSWQGENCCNWYGIRCSNSGYVTAVILRNPDPGLVIRNTNSELVPLNSTSTAIRGTIPSSFFTLGHIHHLDLSFNDFVSSRIPPGLSNLTRLTYLNLSNAVFEDSITTQFANLTSLKWLDLSCSSEIADRSSLSYNLTSRRVTIGLLVSLIYGGQVSSLSLDWLMGLRSLKELRLSGVDLSQASQSSRWANPISLLHNLGLLHLSGCRISGNIPIMQLLNLTSLYSLRLDYNNLSSPLPKQLANLTSISILDLTNCSLHGSVPYIPQVEELYLGNNMAITIDLSSVFADPWPSLKSLVIQSTQVIGSIPPSLANSTSLTEFMADSCSIQGPLPPTITDLTWLEILSLNDNNITGHLPQTISKLKSLHRLSLLQNALEGLIPDTICSLSSLEYLNLQANLLTGSLPNCIGLLPSLHWFSVVINKLNGTIPSLTYLFQKSSPVEIALGYNEFTVKVHESVLPSDFQPQILELGSCNLGGKIPDFISNLTQIVYLGLSNNSLSGAIPPWLFKLPNLCLLDLSGNELQGFLPPSIQLYSNLWPTTLNLARNNLEGQIPHNLQNVEVMDLSGNNFTGQIPIEVGELQSIRYLSLSGNKLFGQIPPSFCHPKNVLMLLDLSGNNLSGKVPAGLGNCTSLLYLNLGMNNLSGNIPNELEHAQSLNQLLLNGNHFDGTFPSFIQKLQFLEVLNLADNAFQGRIPQFIGNLQNLRILVLASNFFGESIPRGVNNLGKLQFMDLSNNEISGPIPEKMDGLLMLKNQPSRGNILGSVIQFMFAGVKLHMVIKGSLRQFEMVCTYHTGIDLSCNKLVGNIPQEIGLLQGLYNLNLSHNGLYGNIPIIIGQMSDLGSLDLSCNNLSGEIPSSITLLDPLSYLDLCFNNFSGEIPRGPHFDTLSRDGLAYAGNKFLCGAPGARNCKTGKEESSNTQTIKGEDFRERLYLYGSIVAGYGVGLWGFIFVLCSMDERWRERYWRAIDKTVLRVIHCF